MFPNLKAEMARHNVTVLVLSDKTGIPYSTLAPKVRGDKPLKFREAEKIKEALHSNLPLEVLFGGVADD